MIVSDGILWFNSNDILMVGRRVENNLSVYLKGLHGVAQLQFPSPEMAVAVHMRLILQIAAKEEIRDITEYLFSEAKSKGLDIEKVKKHFNEIINQKGGKDD